jgi:hypothetical protein
MALPGLLLSTIPTLVPERGDTRARSPTTPGFASILTHASVLANGCAFSCYPARLAGCNCEQRVVELTRKSFFRMALRQVSVFFAFGLIRRQQTVYVLAQSAADTAHIPARQLLLILRARAG